MTTAFSGVTLLKAGISANGVFLDRPDTDNGLARSATVSPGMSTSSDMTSSTQYTDGRLFTGATDAPKSAGMERSKTAAATVPTPREPGNSRLTPPDSAPAGVARSNTQITPARASPNAAIGGPVRGLSVRKPGASPGNPPTAPPKGEPISAPQSCNTV